MTTGKTVLDQAEAVALMLEKYEVCRGLSRATRLEPWLVRA
jgi:hypothetical protein